MAKARTRSRSIRLLIGTGLSLVCAATALAVIFPMTVADFHLRGTQMGEIGPATLQSSDNCRACHGNFDQANEPSFNWQGSLMGQAGRDPLFFAQMTLANQDVSNAGYFCMRCHVPMTYVTGNAMPPDGSAIGALDRDGVSCHFCHTMVDPIYKPGISPPQDQAILAALISGAPQHYGNSMFVLDPTGARRGPRTDAWDAPHGFIASPFHNTGQMCGTCHEVGNVAVTRQANGTYSYNALNTPTPTEDCDEMFPLERTFSEWKLSAFANGGVDMGGRFNGTGPTVVSTCQDCHMPKALAQACSFGPERPHMARHEFAGAGAQVLDIIAAYTLNDPAVDQAAIAAGRAASVSMLQRAATLQTSQASQWLNVRVINEGGHKLPTGHIEGRRVWVSVAFEDALGTVIGERGGYDHGTATLDTATTTVFEMHVGLDAAAAAATGLPEGPTGHMALANTIEKDNRIPPRGFNNAAYAAAGAPVVGATYADGQYWADVPYIIPPGTARAVVGLYYQNTPREYIEHLRDHNHTDHWGLTLYTLWEATGRGAPIEMATASIAIAPPCFGDHNADGVVNTADLVTMLGRFGQTASPGTPEDLNGDGAINTADLVVLLGWFGTTCP